MGRLVTTPGEKDHQADPGVPAVDATIPIIPSLPLLLLSGAVSQSDVRGNLLMDPFALREWMQ